jgi:hypothetical protein
MITLISGLLKYALLKERKGRAMKIELMFAQGQSVKEVISPIGFF